MSNNVPTDAGRRSITAPVINDHGPGLGKFILVGFASTVINGSVVGLLFVVSLLMGLGLKNEAPAAEVKVEQVTEVEEPVKEFDLTNTDLGMDDSVPLNFNVDRIEEVSVPGMVDPTQAVGIDKAPEGPPMNIPLPPGAGGGTGGAPLDPNVLGTGQAFGAIGGGGGFYSPGGFSGRSGATRKKMLQEGGGNAASEKAVADGLLWLALHQSSDGHWGLNDFNKAARDKPLPYGKVVGDNSTPMTTRRNDTAGTAFGLLPFLAAGITHKPSAKKQQTDYSKTVRAGVDFLIRKQSKSGNDRGYYGDGMYAHGLATIAMCEVYGLTSDPRLKASSQMALDYIVRAQDPTGGGWRYAPRQAGDTSVVGWQMMALKSGQMSGLSVPRAVLTRAKQYLDSAESASKMGGYSYVPGGNSTPAMTAVGALCRQYMGTNPRNPSLIASVKMLKALPPSKTPNLYYLYYATQVMHHMGGEWWTYWNLGPDGNGKGGIRDTLISRQETRGGNRGSFAGNEHVGGRLGGTSLSLLTLEVYYRHLPLYRRDAGMAKPDDDK